MVCGSSAFHGMSSLRKRTRKILLPVFSVLAVIVQNDTVVAAGSEPLDEHLRLCIKDFMEALLEYPLIPMLYDLKISAGTLERAIATTPVCAARTIMQAATQLLLCWRSSSKCTKPSCAPRSMQCRAMRTKLSYPDSGGRGRNDSR